MPPASPQLNAYVSHAYQDMQIPNLDSELIATVSATWLPKPQSLAAILEVFFYESKFEQICTSMCLRHVAGWTQIRNQPCLRNEGVVYNFTKVL